MSFQLLSNPRVRILLLLGIIGFVFLYYSLLISSKGTILQDKEDWGIDMGYTQLFFGVLLVLLCLFFIIYPKQHIFRDRNITRTHVLIFGSIIFFAVVGASFFSWIAHDPTLNFFHNPIWDNLPVDKFGHLFWSFVLTLSILTVKPRRAYAIILWMIFALYELFEVVVIYNFGETQFDKDVATVLATEMADIPLDLFFNTIGWLLAIFVVVIIFKRKFRR